MKHLSFICFNIWVILSNALSNPEFPNMGHQPKDLPTQFRPYSTNTNKSFEELTSGIFTSQDFCKIFKSEDLPYNAFNGLHSINQYGWFITTIDIAKNIIKIRSIPCYTKFNEFYGLALLKFNHYPQPSCLEETKLLEFLADQNDLNQYSWVLSLSKLPTKPNLPIQALSQIKERKNGLLLLIPGTLTDFYKESTTFFKNELLSVFDKITNKIEYYSTEEYKPILQEQCIEKYALKIYSNKKKIYNQKNKIRLNQIKKKRDKYIYLYQQFMNNSLKNLNSSAKWNKEWTNHIEFLNQKKYSISNQKERLKNYTLTPKDIDNFWGFRNPWNGIADLNDIGGGIYGFPKFFPQENDLFNKDSIVRYGYRSHLVGITIPQSIDNKSSIAVDLVSPYIKKWIFETIVNYHKN